MILSAPFGITSLYFASNSGGGNGPEKEYAAASRICAETFCGEFCGIVAPVGLKSKSRISGLEGTDGGVCLSARRASFRCRRRCLRFTLLFYQPSQEGPP